MFFAKPNLVAQAVTPVECPWDYVGYPPPGLTKAQRNEWYADIATQYQFVSVYEGVTSIVRISDENQPHRMHGLIVDYDGNVTDEMIELCKTKPSAEFHPAWAVKTASGHGRLYWAFERSLLLANMEQLKQFLLCLRKRLNLTKWLPGLDAGALGSPQLYYAHGIWVELNRANVIPSNQLELWLYEVSRTMSLLPDNAPTYKVPLDRVAEEVEERFPGRWHGPFEVGKQGVRFWDSDAKDPRGAMVLDHGMLAFTGEQAFVPWSRIFGRAFVEQFEADKIGKILPRCAFDGKAFWYDNGVVWQDWTDERMQLILKKAGFNPKRGKDSPTSEVEDAIFDILMNRRVERALPFVHRPKGIIPYEGGKFLNISRASVMPPSPPVNAGVMTWRDLTEHAPFLSDLLKTFFSDASDEGGEQLQHFLAWLKYAYVNAMEGHPRIGQCVVIAGPTGKGKTFIAQVVVGGLFGGFRDASYHLVEGEQWTDDIVGSPVLLIDDSLATSDRVSQLKFSARVKKLVANGRLRFNGKFMQTGTLPFEGRIMILCNLDAESLRIIPSMDISTKDKIMLFKASEHKVRFGDWDQNAHMAARELPLLARFLLDWPFPDFTIASEKRYGVTPYWHPELLDESHQQGNQGTLMEVLHPWAIGRFNGDKAMKEIERTGAELFSELCAFNDGVMRMFNALSLATAMGHLAKTFPAHIKNKRARGHRVWVISKSLIQEDCDIAQ